MRSAFRRGFVLALCAWGLTSGCGGSGSPGGGGPTGPSPMLLFTADRAAGANSVAMRAGAGTTVSRLELEIFASDLVNVQTMDLTIGFPGGLLQFDGLRPGGFLGAGASFVVQQAGAGAVTVLMTRTSPGGATGSGVVATIDLRVVAGGNGRLDFIDPEATDPFGIEIQGIDWIGGTVQIVS